jgi:hypothetical protein
MNFKVSISDEITEIIEKHFNKHVDWNRILISNLDDSDDWRRKRYLYRVINKQTGYELLYLATTRPKLTILRDNHVLPEFDNISIPSSKLEVYIKKIINGYYF